MRATEPAVRRLCQNLGSVGFVDDLVQETYLRAARSLRGFRSESPVLPWLLTIARRTCADHVRRRQRERRLVDRLESEVRTAPTVHQPSVPIDDVLDALPQDRRDAFVLTQFQGLSYEEAAEVLGCAVGTIRSRVSRARQALLGAVDADAEASSRPA